MAIGFRSNIAAMNAQRRLEEANGQVARVFERLSSGQRINRAADDAAGLAVASSLNVSRRVFTQGVRNLNDGLSLLNIADSTVEELSGITIRIRELAAQSSNGVFSSKQRAALDTEAQTLAREFLRISRTANFNKLNLFDGSLRDLRFQAGFGTDGGIATGLGGAIGTGSFVATNSGLMDSQSTVIGDLNLDGIADLIGIKNGTVSVRYGASNGSLGARETLATENNNFSMLALGDVNGDGKVDIVTAGDEGFQVLTQGDGNSFTFGNAQNTNPGTFVNRVLRVGDLNNDGRADIILGQEDTDLIGASMTLFRSASDGSFIQTTSPTLPYSNLDPSINIQLADLNSDGYLDILTVKGFQDGAVSRLTVSSFLNNQQGEFGSGNTVYQGVGGSPSVLLGFSIGDIDNDGKADIALLSSDNGSRVLRTFRGNSNGTFSLTQNLNLTASLPLTTTNLHLADLNGDGSLDLTLQSVGSSVYTMTGSANLFFSNLSNTGISSTADTISVGDLNGDGVPDIFDQNLGGYSNQTVNGIHALEPFSLRTRIEALETLARFSAISDRLLAQRGQIGAMQSRITSASNVLQVATDAFAAAEGRIRDTDIASDSARLTALSIGREFAASVLAQANQQPQIGLSLLR